jgi:hypothetical protein
MTQRRNADGSTVRYYQLAENVWDAKRGCAVARVVHNFGRADQIDGDMLRRLAKSILRIFPDSASPAQLQVPDLVMRDAWPYGAVYVLSHLWKELGIGDVLAACVKKQNKTQPLELALFAMVANRAIAPSSKLFCWEQWLREDVFLPAAQSLELHHLYRGLDFLEEHKPIVEKEVYFRMADLMNADVDVLFYDTTSLHFEVDEEDEVPLTTQGRMYQPLRKRGYSKNGREDAPQVVVGLAVTRDGLPVRSWVFSGETADVTTVQRVKDDLRGWRLGRCVFVGDAGMNSEENRRSLSLGNGKYILASRMHAGDEVSKEVLTRPGRYRELKDNLHIKEVFVGDGVRRRRYVVCYNQQEQTRQRLHREKLLEHLEAELQTLTQPQQGDSHSKRACDLLTSRRFAKYLRKTPNGHLCIDRSAIKDAARYDGKWVITSNDDTLTAQDLALGYKQLMRVEECWRKLKSGLRVRPVFHYRPWRIQAHISLSVLALLLERIVELRTGDTWRNVCAQLETLKVVEYDRPPARVRQTTAPRPEVIRLLEQLRIPLPPLLHSVETLPTAAAEPSEDHVALPS